MYEHLQNIGRLYGDAYVQIPNGVFKDLAQSIKSRNSTNIQQSSFAYTYLVTIAFLYKYAHFVDIDNGTYIQNSDIKQILGYGKTTKTIDKVIKKNGILDSLGLVRTTKDYPIGVEYAETGDIALREFITISMLDTDDINYNTIKDIVKNRNYEIKEPTFLFEYGGDLGSLYNYNNTHRIDLKEFMKLVYDDSMDNTDFMMYSFFKSKCYGYKDNMRSIALHKIVLEMGMSRDTFYIHLNKLKEKGYVTVNHKGWRMMNEKNDNLESNDYYFNKI